MNNSQFKEWILNAIGKSGFVEVSEADRRSHIGILDGLRNEKKIKIARHGTEFTRYEINSSSARNPDYRPDQHKHDLKNRW